MTYIKKITSNIINADKYENFMNNTDKYTDFMFNTDKYKFDNIFNYYKEANFI